MRILLTRPKQDSEALALRLNKLGHVALITPLIEIVPHDEAKLRLDGVQALLATSSNGVRALASHTQGGAARLLPLFAVGEATAHTARAAGFESVRVAGGDVNALAALVSGALEPKQGRLVHIAGHDRAGDLKASLRASGFDVEVAVLYEAKAAKALPVTARAALRAGELDAVLLYSPRTAGIYADLICAQADEFLAGARKLHHLCLSHAVARALEPLGLDSSQVMVAAEPNQDALLACLGTVKQAGNASP